MLRRFVLNDMLYKEQVTIQQECVKQVLLQLVLYLNQPNLFVRYFKLKCPFLNRIFVILLRFSSVVDVEGRPERRKSLST